jgi:hypothetical protein
MKLNRFLPIALILVVAAFAAACSTDPTPTPVPPTATPEAMMDDDSMADGDAMMDDGTMKDGDAMMDDGAMTDGAMKDGDAMMDDGAMTDGDAMMDNGAMTDGDAMMDNGAMLAEGVQARVSGNYKGRHVEYYDFGANSPSANGAVSTAPIYVFINGFDADGNPTFVDGQHNIVNSIPGVDGYSDLWQVMLVEVPDTYVADTIQSKAEIDAAGYSITATDILVNCPIVPADTMLEGGEELTQGWYNGTAVYYPDFGMNPATTAPIYAFITGLDTDGNPIFVEGQHNVIDVVPGDAGYSAFWQVNLVIVPDDYVAGTIKDLGGITASGYEMIQPGLVVNCPVTVVTPA